MPDLFRDLWIVGEPKGQPRARAFAMKGKVRMYDPHTAEAWKGQIAAAVQPYVGTPTEAPVRVKAVFMLPRPKRLMRDKDPAGPLPHTAKPDADNLIKAVLDALTQIGLWRDDTQVCELRVIKRYTAKNWSAGLWLSVATVEAA